MVLPSKFNWAASTKTESPKEDASAQNGAKNQGEARTKRGEEEYVEESIGGITAATKKTPKNSSPVAECQRMERG